MGLEDAVEAVSEGGVACESLGVAAEGVVFWIGDEACADGVEVDVGGDGLEGFWGIFDECAGEAFGPEGAETAGVSVEPAAEALLEFLHEGGDIAHAAGEGVSEVWTDGA